MDDDFALLDFALVAESPANVALALATALRPPTNDPAQGERRRSGLGRLLPRAEDPSQGHLLIQPRSSLPPTPIVQAVLDDLGMGVEELVLRVSGPIQDTDLTLIEFRASDAERVALCADLSAVLREREIFYFRLSGARHPGGHYAFHVYQNGLASRRTATYSAAGDHQGTEWDSLDAGIFHPLETQGMSSSHKERGPIITPERQGSILAALNLNADTLFEGVGDRHTVLVLSPTEGGSPVEEARAHSGSGLRGPATFREAATDIPVPMAERFSTTTPASGIAAAPEVRAEKPEPAAAPIPLQNHQSWEEEVMAILIDVVDHALLEEEQAPWLNGFTARLNSGEICEALADAQVLIGYSDRPEEERLRLAARLAQLFVPADEV